MMDREPNEQNFHQPQRWTETALSDEWEALVGGAPGEAPETAAFVRSVVEDLAVIDQVPPLTYGRREQMWHEVLAMASVPTSPVPTRLVHSRNGVKADRSAVQVPPSLSSSRERLPRLGAHLAAAALVLLTLLGSIVALGGSFRLEGPAPRGVIIPAVDSTPERHRADAAITDDILLRATLEQMPSSGGTPQLALWRSQLAPGAEEPVGSHADTGVGNELCTLESGQVTIEADGPVFLTRAGTNMVAAPSRVDPGTTVILDVGDQLLAPSGVTFRRRNDASAAASILCFSIGTYGDSARIWANQPGVSYVPGLPFKLLSAFPSVPVEATVHRLTLAPGTEFAIRDLPGLELVYVEAGTLDLIYAKASALDLLYAKAETPATPERSFAIRAGSGTETFGRTPERTVLANRGTEPLVLLTASVVPASAKEATPQSP